MRDRLIELLEKEQQASIEYSQKKIKEIQEGAKGECIKTAFEFSADYLLENGVIVPPCKVGQKVYVIHNTVERIEMGLKDCIYETVIDAIHISGTVEYHLCYKKIVHPDCDFFTEKDIGKTVFFTKEEAEQALSKLQASYKQVKEGVQE